MLAGDRLTCSAAAPFWVAVLHRHAADPGHARRALLSERAGVLNPASGASLVAGAFTGWLTVYQGGGLVGGRGRGRGHPARYSALHGWLTVSLALSQHVTVWASRSLRRAWRAMPTA